MDIAKMLNELRAERENIEQAILTLERLAAGRSGAGERIDFQVRSKGLP
jgi:hypothetical protein